MGLLQAPAFTRMDYCLERIFFGQNKTRSDFTQHDFDCYNLLGNMAFSKKDSFTSLSSGCHISQYNLSVLSAVGRQL